jgi:hypothetical protein
MNPIHEAQLNINRRQLLRAGPMALGSLALGGLLKAEGGALPSSGLHHAPRAKRIIYLFQSGAPSQLDLFDHKPGLQAHDGIELPDSVRMGQRLTGMTSGQSTHPVRSSRYKFKRHGESGAWVSEMLPHTAGVADKLCFVRSMHTEAINHDPAITFFQTGNQQPGRPSIGSWFSYGLGSENEDLPAFVVMLSKNTNPIAQPIYDRLWGAGFLPSNHQGVKLRSQGAPVLFLDDPAGSSRADERRMLDRLAELNELRAKEIGDPEVTSRIAQYEMAHRMQMSVPELTDISDEPDSTFELYGDDARVPGTHAANCLLARRLAERGVRFIQLFHRGWDHHFDVPKNMPIQCGETDQGSAALVTDLAQRGLLEDTIVIWGGEFGRTVYAQGSSTLAKYGRDHHPRCFTVWMAGGGFRPGTSYGETDDFSYNIARDPVSVHDLHATIMHCMGIDHRKLTHLHAGRDFRLTDVHGEVVSGLLS